MRGIVAPLFPLLEGRVLCSGALGVRKPDAAAFTRALDHFGVLGVPQQPLSLGRIAGVGQKKLDAYGDAFLGVIRAG